MRKIICLHLLATVLIGTSACTTDTGSPLTCTLPCIDSAPTLSASSIDSSTGGTVTVSFHINGSVTDIAAITVLMKSTNATSINTIGGIFDGMIISPASNNISATFNVSAGSTLDTYFPYISITTTNGDGAQYYIDPTKSNSSYTYTEVIGSAAGTPQLSNLTIPTVSVTSSGGGTGGIVYTYEGSVASPVNIGNYPVSGYSGTVGSDAVSFGYSYYKVDNISAGTYTVALTNATNHYWLEVYSDSGFANLLCRDAGSGISAGDRTCTANPSSGPSLYIAVLNVYNNDGSFDLSVQ